MAASYRESKGRFIFYNENPKGSLSADDCVIRAIAKATGKTWDETYHELCLVGFSIKDVPSADSTFKQYLKQEGYQMEKQPRKSDNTKYTAEQFAKKYNEGIYIISLANHLSMVQDGKIYDTWNCSNKCVGNYWEVR
jgi:hypothetical protein